MDTAAIAKLLQEDIRINNGFLLEADPRLEKYNVSSGGGIIIMKRGTVIECNRIFDDGGSIVRATVGPPLPAMVLVPNRAQKRNGYLTRVSGYSNYMAEHHPDAYKAGWVSFPYESTPEKIMAGEVKPYTPEQTQKIRDDWRTAKDTHEVNIARITSGMQTHAEQLIQYINDANIQLIDPATRKRFSLDTAFTPHEITHIIQRLIDTVAGSTLREKLRTDKTFMQALHAIKAACAEYNQSRMVLKDTRSRGHFIVERPFGKIISIKRENIHRIDAS